MLDFNNQVILITGAGRGIGRQHALFLASRGARVIVNDFGGDLRGEAGNNPQPADSVVAEIKASGAEAMAICSDIGNPDDVKTMVQQVLDTYGRIDAVIHNASVYAKLSAFEDAKVEDLDRIMRVNVNGGWNLAQAVWKTMQAQGYGRIVITGSGAGFFGRKNDLAYSIAKGALQVFTKLLAEEGEKHNIKANLIGPVSFTDNAFKQGIPEIMEKFAPPIAISNLVALLVHDDCPVSGEMFHCGGGFISRIFMCETQGAVTTLDKMSPQWVLDNLPRIVDEEDYMVPSNSGRSGAHLSASIASVNPEFAALLASAKQNRQGA